jgi:hypothetical protein
MATWASFTHAEPEFAARVESLFRAHKHMTMATLRRDGSPRISGTEVQFTDDEMTVGMMDGSLKGRDLQRDPRIAIHSPSVDPPDDPTEWVGEAKVAGRAVEHGGGYTIDVLEVVLTRVLTDHLVIESWTPTGGLVARDRY